MIKNYFKIALRNLWRHRKMSAINITGLGIGMGATILIVLWVQNELSFDTYQPDSENIYRIKAQIMVSKNEPWLWENSQYVLGEHASKQIPGIENIARIRPSTYNDLILHYNGQLITEKKSAYVDAQWFNMFHYDFIEGSAESFNKNPFSLILTESTAKKYFGNSEAVGRILRVDTVNYQVQAVVKDNPTNSSFQFNVLIPATAQQSTDKEKKNIMNWGNYFYLTFFKLTPGTNPAKVSAQLKQILLFNQKNRTNVTYSLVRLRDMHFENDLQRSATVHGNRKIVNIFMVLAVLLLVTACINYVNLTTARASIRAREVSIRKIVGAGRLQLFWQFMSESFIVSFSAVILALVLVKIGMPWFESVTDKQFIDPLSSAVVWKIIGVTLVISFLLNGLYPALLLSSFQPLNIFKGKNILNFKDAGLRRTLVVIQFTISVILIISTIVIFRQLNYMETVDLGYNKSQVFSFDIPWKVWGRDEKKREAGLKTVLQELKQQSEIANVAMGSTGIVDFGNMSSGSFDWTGRAKDFMPSVAPFAVDQNFKDLMQLKMRAGRWFNGGKTDEHNVVLNETAVATFQMHQPVIGQRFMHQGDTGVVVGVVKDFHYKSLHEKIGPMVISDGPGDADGFYVKIRPENTAQAIKATQAIFDQFAAGEPFVYEFLDESYNNLYKAEQQSLFLISLFAGIAILISALGLLGLAAFAAEQKIKEIGIRKVLGASVKHILAMLSTDFIKTVVIASVIAFPITWWAMNKWLQDFAYRVSLSWWVFLAGAFIAVLIALITVSIQSLKAATANPVNSLRSE